MLQQVTYSMTAEASEKKVVKRATVIFLGVVCIILSASLVATLVLYLPTLNAVSQLKSEIAAKNNVIGSQNSTISSQIQQITALQNSLQQASDKDEEIDYLRSYVSDLLNIIYMNASATLLRNQGVQLGANDSFSLWSDYLTYAGYITVQVQSSSNTTYVQVTYTAFEVYYDEKIVVGTDGVASFPVLPTSMIDIRLGNSEPSEVVSATVTVVYRF